MQIYCFFCSAPLDMRKYSAKHHFLLPAFALQRFTIHIAKRKQAVSRRLTMNTYDVTYSLPKSSAGIVKETVTAASDQNARDLIRAKFSGQEVRMVSSRQTSFGGGRDDNRGGKR